MESKYLAWLKLIWVGSLFPGITKAVLAPSLSCSMIKFLVCLSKDALQYIFGMLVRILYKGVKSWYRIILCNQLCEW